jgi:hypothetical protein
VLLQQEAGFGEALTNAVALAQHTASGSMTSAGATTWTAASTSYDLPYLAAMHEALYREAVARAMAVRMANKDAFNTGLERAKMVAFAAQEVEAFRALQSQALEAAAAPPQVPTS